LDASRTTWLCPDTLLISTRAGTLLALSFEWDGRAVTGLDLYRVGSAVLSSHMTSLGPSLVFLASCVGDSLLIHLRERKPTPKALEGESIVCRSRELRHPSPSPSPSPAAGCPPVARRYVAEF